MKHLSDVLPNSPVAALYILFGSPSIETDEITAVNRTMESGWTDTRPRVHEFEKANTAYVGEKFGAATSSCTAALHLVMRTSGLQPGDEVITTPLAFCATANAIIHRGATPVFADCARNSTVGSISDLTCFSFYVTNNLTTGEDGIVTTNSEELANKIRTYALHGISADAWARFSDSGSIHCETVFPGFKHNLTDLAAALGLGQLPRLEEWLHRRMHIWNQYDQAFSRLRAIVPATPEPNTVHVRHLYTLPLTDESPVSRDEFMFQMRRHGIGTGVHDRALHPHTYSQLRWEYLPKHFPNTAWVDDRTVSLPLSPKLRDLDVERIVTGVREILEGQMSSPVWT